MENKEDFKTVKWIRQVRDKNSSKYDKLDLKDFATELSKEAKKSHIWERIKKKKKHLTK